MNQAKSAAIQKRANWGSNQLKDAMDLIRRGVLSQREASNRFQIPRRTLRNHLKSGSTTRKLGRCSTFTPEQEEDLVKRIIRLAEVGMPLTPKILRLQAFKFCERYNIPHHFNDEKSLAGKKWLNLFLKRHPEIARRKSQVLNPARAQKLNKTIVTDHFQKVEALLEKLAIKQKPECIYNMDEKGCRISLHHEQSVLAMKGAKRVHLITNEHAESVTIVGCVNALGVSISPMVLFKGKRLKPEFTDNLPPGSLVRMTPKGYMTHSVFVDFIKHLSRYKATGSCLLIFDGAACHLDFSIVEEAEEHNITLYCLPSNTTHELQPLDKAVYRSFEHHWDQELLKFIAQNPERKLNKSSFNMIFSKVWSKCMTHDNIVSGFRATGLYPFNPDSIPEIAFAPSALSELPNPMSNERAADVRKESSSSDSESENLPLSMLRASTRQSASKPGTSKTTGLKQGTTQASVKSPFQQLLPTPKNKTIKSAPRKKALNYRGQEVTKDLFSTSAKTASITSTVTSGSAASSSKASKSTVSHKGAWYCPVCHEDRMQDMRQCQECSIWYHELCVGLIEEDEDFICPGCCS